MNPDTDSLEELIASITGDYESTLTAGSSSGMHLHSSPSLGTYLSSKPHRGADIEPKRRVLGAGDTYPSGAVAGDVFYRTDIGVTTIYDGKNWNGLPTTTPDPAVESITGWAAGKLPNDNDVIYIRRKNDRLFWTEGNKMGGTSWREINGTGILPTGLKQEIVDIDNVAIPVEVIATPEIETGWYQDDKGDLYEYKGSGEWNLPRGKTSSKGLAELALTGELEFLG